MSFFKAYDMRGTYGVDFDLPLVERIGRELPEVLARANGSPTQRMLVGRDCRTTSPAVSAALVRGLSAAGVAVTDIGPCTTPMVYFFTAEDGYDGSVMVTASHNPPGDNGLKVSRRGALPVGYADGLDEVARRVGPHEPSLPFDEKLPPETACTNPKCLARYVAWQRQRLSPRTQGGADALRYAVDCSNGMASIFARELFPDAVLLNDTPDGTFPCHAPNPLKAEARAQLSATVREKGLDFGIVFDGDADRAMFVDERGAFVQPDYLIPVVARASQAGAKSETDRLPAVLHDVRTSRGALETLRLDGFEPVMVPVGHAFAKPQMRLHNAVCGGELAGHYYFRDFFNCDSGVLAALRIVGAYADWRATAKATGRDCAFSAMMAPIISRYANSGELNYKVDDKDAAIARMLAAAKDFGAETGRSTMDGVRLEFADGWISVRKSNTEPYLRLLVENRSPERMRDWVAHLEAALA